jgi:membrane protein DedA with SNARE-associated domain
MEHLLATWGYLAIFAVTLISSVGIPVGSEIAIAYGGALASGQLGGHEHLHLLPVILVALAGELVGSSVGYAVGMLGGRPLVDRVGKYVLLTHRDLDRAERWFDGRGESVVLFGRLVPLLRSFMSLAAGLAEMTVWKFAVFTTIGCAIWCATLSSVGYSLGSSWRHVVNDFSLAGYLALVLAVLVVVAALAHRVRAVRADRVARADRVERNL